ncbi:unnamed protein product [Polarella glacialis]|uniref:Uncharacterized protein n=1 Tax=Polarella glacialis TaxID=89957 RepID=A0A813G763_POLGL|nr:unnamed protein product [Polarella glacialis]
MAATRILNDCFVNPRRLQLFDANIECLGSACIWEMCLRKIKTPVPVTMNWLVSNMLKMMLALLKQEIPLDPEVEPKDMPAKEKEIKIDNLFYMGLVWSFGCVTDAPGRKIMNEYIRTIMGGEKVKEKYDLIVDDPTYRPMAKTPFPEGVNSVFEYFAFGATNKWELWTKKITGFDIPKEAQVHTIMVPTADTVRSAYMLQTMVASEHHILFSGLTGTGKTVIINKELLNRFDKEKYTVIAFAFSAQTTANQTQDIIDGKLDKRKKGTFGPPFGKRCLMFVDDLNMPAKEKYGAQPPIELLRQWMDAGGWYDRKDYQFRKIVDLNFVAAMGPPGAGRPFLTGRYQRHYNLIFVTPFEQESLNRIFVTVMQWFLGRFAGAVAEAAKAVVKSTISLYEDISAEMLPTPAKSHYTFNLRDLARVTNGICACSKKSMDTADDLARCWAHEAHRVFYDRLVNKDDQKWFKQKTDELLKENFKKDWKQLVKAEPLIWCDFIDPKANFYQQVNEPEKLVEVLGGCLQDYNSMAKRGMDLVLFMAAAQHVSQIVRVLKTPLGNCLLVGVGGSGRKSLATLATFVAEQESFAIEITKSYGMNDWHDDLKRLLIRCGGMQKEVCFLLPDTQIANENFVEETSGLLNNGEVPNLFNVEDKAQILELCTAMAAKEGRFGPAEVMAFFIEQCQKNLHIVLAFSPIGEAFRRRVRMFPSLVNCCTIDWFHEWPDQALQSVANYFLTSEGLEPKVLKGVVDVCVAMQKAVFTLAERFQKEVQRYYYVTPTSYLELINAFKELLGFKRSEVERAKSRYDVGLDKIISTEAQVSTMQIELEELKPTLKRTAEETAQLMIVIEGKKEEAAATEAIVSKDAAETSIIAESAGKMAADCQRDLDKAMPALNSAIEALSQLSKGDIVEVKAMKTPPGGVILVSKALCWAFNVKPKKVPAPDGRSKMDDYWEPAKKELWGDPKLLDKLLYFDKDNIPADVMVKLAPLETDPEFEPDAIKKASVAAFGICKWVRAMIVYDQDSPKSQLLSWLGSSFWIGVGFPSPWLEVLRAASFPLDWGGSGARKIEAYLQVARLRLVIVRSARMAFSRQMQGLAQGKLHSGECGLAQNCDAKVALGAQSSAAEGEELDDEDAYEACLQQAFPLEQRSRWLPAGACSLVKAHPSAAKYLAGTSLFKEELPPEAMFCWSDVDFEVYIKSQGSVRPKLKLHYYVSPECPQAIVDLVAPVLGSQNWSCTVTAQQPGEPPPIFIWEGSRRTIDPAPTLSFHGLVNRVGPLFPLTTKVGMLQAVHAWCSRAAVDFPPSWYPLTFRLPEDLSIWKRCAEADSKRRWIYKPNGGARGIGIILISKVKVEDMDSPEEPFASRCRSARPSDLSAPPLAERTFARSGVIQEYVQDLLLLCRRKFAVRTYLLVARVKPLLVLLHGAAYAKVCGQEYDPASFSQEDLFRHVTNQEFQKTGGLVHENWSVVPVMTLAEVDAQLAAEASFHSGHNINNNNNNNSGQPSPHEMWSAKFWRQVREICLQVVACFRDPVCKDGQLGTFEILGLDFICKADGSAIFLEANRDPSWVVDGSTKQGLIPALVEEMLNIVLRSHGHLIPHSDGSGYSDDRAFRFETLVDDGQPVGSK